MWDTLRRLAPGFGLPSRGAAAPDAELPRAAPGRRTVRVYFIKPSQYDPDGFVLRYRWGVIPNNTLTVLAGLNAAYAQRRPDVDVQTVLWDELFDGVVSPAVLAALRDRAAADGVEPIVGLAGVQTGQYPRARDIGLQAKRLGLPVLAGGFHVSSDAPSRAFLRAARITVVVGEAETTWPVLLDDYLRGALRGEYAVTGGLRAKTGLGDIAVPAIHDAPLPALDARYRRGFFNPTMSTLDTARGCPFACSYCAVKNVMGRTMRARDPRRVVEWVRDAHDRHGIRSLFLVDDDLYRSPHWEAVLTGLAALRRDGRDLTFMMQCDVEASVFPAAGPRTPRHERSRRFVELAAAAGCYAAFVGFESFNPANLDHTLKVQNQDRRDRGAGAPPVEDAAARVKARYRNAVDNWHRAGVAVHCGYMIGLPFDGKGSGVRAARDLTDVGVDVASFFPYTPLPGTEDYEAALAAGGIEERDFNAWDCLHVVNRHPTLTRAEVYREYSDAHRAFYTWRRLAWSLATGYAVPGLGAAARYGMLTQQLYFTYAYRHGWHPMMGGIWRLRDRSVRREAVWDAEAAARYLGAAPADPPPEKRAENLIPGQRARYETSHDGARPRCGRSSHP